MFKNPDILFKDPRYIEMKEQYEKLGEHIPGYNMDEYSGTEDFINKCRKRLDKILESN